MNSPNRTKKIEAYMNSQAATAQAVRFFEHAKLVLELTQDGCEGISPAQGRVAARILRQLGLVLEQDARAICQAGEVSLPPEVEKQLQEAKTP